MLLYLLTTYVASRDKMLASYWSLDRKVSINVV